MLSAKKLKKKDAIVRALVSALERIKGDKLYVYKDKDTKTVNHELTVALMQQVASTALDLIEKVDE